MERNGDAKSVDHSPAKKSNPGSIKLKIPAQPRPVLRYKEKFHQLRERFTQVSSTKAEHHRNLDIAYAKMKKLQAENDMLLDAILSSSPQLLGSVSVGLPPSSSPPAAAPHTHRHAQHPPEQQESSWGGGKWRSHTPTPSGRSVSVSMSAQASAEFDDVGKDATKGHNMSPPLLPRSLSLSPSEDHNGQSQTRRIPNLNPDMSAKTNDGGWSSVSSHSSANRSQSLLSEVDET